jgi:hypothetical protein
MPGLGFTSPGGRGEAEHAAYGPDHFLAAGFDPAYQESMDFGFIIVWID